MPWLINAAQLDKFRKSQKSLIILDASWHTPNEKRDARQAFADKHIVGASFFDIDIFSDPSTDAPHSHMVLRDEKILAEKIGSLGIRNDYKIIFYDNSKSHTSCRALWMLKLFGHNPQQLYILDGGLDAWEKYGGKTESGASNPSAKQYTVNFQEQYLRTLSQMKANLHTKKELVIDTRHAVRFAGGPEPRPCLRSGHIPNSVSFPSSTLFESNGHWKPLDKIRKQMEGVSIELNVPIVTTCGTGNSAPIINFVLDLLELPNNAVYNGSWTEWGKETPYPNELSVDERPVETCFTEV